MTAPCWWWPPRCARGCWLLLPPAARAELWLTEACTAPPCFFFRRMRPHRTPTPHHPHRIAPHTAPHGTTPPPPPPRHRAGVAHPGHKYGQLAHARAGAL
jgi:hypothetical protein